jgi:hypothetical protein
MDQLNGARKHGSIFREVRDVASNCKDETRRDILRGRIDLCRADFDLFVISPTQAHMQDLVASWTRLLMAIAAVAPIGGNDPPAGRMERPNDPRLDVKQATG